MLGLDLRGQPTVTASAAGGVQFGKLAVLNPPDGDGSATFGFIQHIQDAGGSGSEHHISDINAPADALIGVFLDDNRPDDEPTPPFFRDYDTPSFSLEFRDDSVDELRQPFFIGDGLTAVNRPVPADALRAGLVQSIKPPVGATRLFLGTMDNQGWQDNEGAFTARVSVDRDADGIFDNVDVDPGDATTTMFTDGAIDGTTGGTIADTGDQAVKIRDAHFSSSGVVISTGPSITGTGEPAVVVMNGEACPSKDALSGKFGGPGTEILLGSNRAVRITCASQRVAVLAGPVQIRFLLRDGRRANVTVSTGNIIKLEPDTSTFTAPASNTETIVVVVLGVERTLAPGATLVIEHDADRDGVFDSADLCPDSDVERIPVPTRTLRPNHTGDETVIDGCNATQILACKPGQNTGEQTFGIGPGTRRVFAGRRGWAGDADGDGVPDCLAERDRRRKGDSAKSTGQRRPGVADASSRDAAGCSSSREAPTTLFILCFVVPLVSRKKRETGRCA